jgi:hypothetical protein
VQPGRLQCHFASEKNAAPPALTILDREYGLSIQISTEIRAPARTISRLPHLATLQHVGMPCSYLRHFDSLLVRDATTAAMHFAPGHR